MELSQLNAPASRLCHKCVEPIELFVVEIGRLGEGHVHSGDPEVISPCQLSDPWERSVVCNPHAAHAGVDVQMSVDGMPGPHRQTPNAVRRIVCVQAERDIPRHQLGAIRIGEHAHEQDGLPNAGIAQRDGSARLHHGKAGNFPHRVEDSSYYREAESVGIVLDHCEDRPAAGEPCHLTHVVAQC